MLTFTGERFLPDLKGEIWLEHWHRYALAARLARGKRVLDVACGEGYGSAHLAGVAAAVTGVDVDASAIAHARARYAELASLQFVCASCEALPLGDASVDLAVSFETIEHVNAAEQRAFVRELKRVLATEGVLVMSSPDKREYSDKTGYANPYHVHELYFDEFAALLAESFAHVRWLGQRNVLASAVYPLDDAASADGADALVKVEEGGRTAHTPAPLYFVAIAGHSAHAVQAAAQGASFLLDAEGVVEAEIKAMHARLQAREHDADERGRLMLDAEARDARGREQLARVEAERASFARALAERDDEIARLRRELAARAGLMGWALTPLRKLRRLLG